MATTNKQIWDLVKAGQASASAAFDAITTGMQPMVDGMRQMGEAMAAAAELATARHTELLKAIRALGDDGDDGDEFKTLFGAATWTPADFADLEARCSAVLGEPVTLKARRSFDSASQWDVTRMSSGRVASDIAAGRLSVVSWTTFPDDDALEQIRQSIPVGHPINMTFRHEIDREMDFHVTPDQFAGEMQRISTRVRGWGRDEIGLHVCFTGFAAEAASGAGVGTPGVPRVRRWMRDDLLDAVDVVAFDPYNTYGYPASDPDPGRWVEPDELIGPWLDLADEFGFDLAINEISCPMFPGDPQRKVRDMARVYDLAEMNAFWWVTYFDVEVGNISDGPDHRIKNPPEHLDLFARRATA